MSDAKGNRQLAEEILNRWPNLCMECDIDELTDSIAQALDAKDAVRQVSDEELERIAEQIRDTDDICGLLNIDCGTVAVKRAAMLGFREAMRRNRGGR